MAQIKPFRAHRPKPEFAQEIACVPYDVINSSEARKLAEGKSKSFLHVIRPEIDLNQEISPYASEVYEKGKENLDALLNSEFMLQEEQPALYAYKLEMKGKTQSGVFGCVSVEDYDNDIILKHELTRPKKEDDRSRHIMTQQAHAEPVMITFKDTAGVQKLLQSVMNESKPLYHFTADDGVIHSIWKIEETGPFVSAFGRIPTLYIADGHHRCKSASRAAAEVKAGNPSHTGQEEYNFFPAVLFPMNEMNILSYNRIVYKVPGNFLEELKKQFDLKEHADPVPAQKGSISIYLDNTWYGLQLPDSSDDDPVSRMDVSRLQEFILEPMLDISDQRTNPNIDFVGGIRGTGELEKLVDTGEADVAISLYPTNIQELIDVSDAGLLMPPKSTWFEPKLRSGLLIHTF